MMAAGVVGDLEPGTAAPGVGRHDVGVSGVHRLTRDPRRPRDVVIREVGRVLVAVDGDGRILAGRPGKTAADWPSTLLATGGGVPSDAVGIPPSNGAVVAEKLLPIALTRSLNAAVLLVPSVIMAKLTELPPNPGGPVSMPFDE